MGELRSCKPSSMAKSQTNKTPQGDTTTNLAKWLKAKTDDTSVGEDVCNRVLIHPGYKRRLVQLGQLPVKAKHVYGPAPAIPRHHLREMCTCVHQKTREGTLMAALFIAVPKKTTRMPTASRRVSLRSSHSGGRDRHMNCCYVGHSESHKHVVGQEKAYKRAQIV